VSSSKYQGHSGQNPNAFWVALADVSVGDSFLLRPVFPKSFASHVRAPLRENQSSEGTCTSPARLTISKTAADTLEDGYIDRLLAKKVKATTRETSPSLTPHPGHQALLSRRQRHVDRLSSCQQFEEHHSEAVHVALLRQLPRHDELRTDT
jgi:hypothetical protein